MSKDQGWRDGYAGSAPRSHDSDYMRSFNEGRSLQISEYDDERHGHHEPSGGHMPRGFWSSCLVRSIIFFVVAIFVIALVCTLLYEAELFGLCLIIGAVSIVGSILYWLFRIAIPR